MMNTENENLGEDTNSEEGVETSRDFEKEAIEMGWKPEEEYKGSADKWRGAKEFVERGEQILPILKSHNKKLRDDVLTSKAEVARLNKAVESSQLAIKALQNSYAESTKHQVAEAKRELREQLKAAKEIGDVDTEMDLLDKMGDLRDAEIESKKAPIEKEEKPAELHPEFVTWNKENPWFGNTTDPEDNKRTQALIKIGQKLRDEGNTREGIAFMDTCMSILKESEKGGSKVEGSSPGTKRALNSGFSSLPDEAKKACHSDNDSFVGPGKMFKNLKEWENHFTNIYNSQEN